MFVLLAGEALHHPYVEVVERFFDEIVAGRDFLIQDFVQILNGLRDVRLTAHTIHAGFIALVEGNRRNRILRVLQPQAHSLICDTKLAIQVLHETDVDLVAPIEDMGVGLRD